MKQACLLGLLCSLAACGNFNLGGNLLSPGPTTEPTLLGRVTDAGGGTPIQGAEVTVSDKRAFTAQDGSYIIQRVRQGPLTIKVIHADYVDTSRDVVVPVAYAFAADFQLQRK